MCIRMPAPEAPAPYQQVPPSPLPEQRRAHGSVSSNPSRRRRARAVRFADARGTRSVSPAVSQEMLESRLHRNGRISSDSLNVNYLRVQMAENGIASQYPTQVRRVPAPTYLEETSGVGIDATTQVDEDTSVTVVPGGSETGAEVVGGQGRDNGERGGTWAANGEHVEFLDASSDAGGSDTGDHASSDGGGVSDASSDAGASVARSAESAFPHVTDELHANGTGQGRTAYLFIRSAEGSGYLEGGRRQNTSAKSQ